MIRHAGHHVLVALDLGQIDRRAQHRQRTSLAEQVLRKNVEQLPMQLRRQPGRIVVPVKDVKSRRCVAQQVVVDPVVPHQIVGSHPGKDAAHFLACQHAA